MNDNLAEYAALCALDGPRFLEETAAVAPNRTPRIL
jgi:hypothetical protein